ncbi:MAG: helix-turn-helix domain-containing protein [Pseudomonadota bacterium]
MLSRLILKDADEIWQFYATLSGMQPGYQQLSAGPAPHVFDVLDLEGVSLVKVRTSGKTRWIDGKEPGDLHFAWVVNSDAAISVGGVDLERSHCMVFLPGHEMEYVFHGNTLTFEICVSEDLLDILGWDLTGSPLCATNEAALQRLSVKCFSLFELLSDPVDDVTRQTLRDDLLSDLEQTLAPWLTKTEHSAEHKDSTVHYRTMRRIDDYLRDFDYSKPLSIDDLVRDLGMSRRTIHYAFRRHLDITPRRYIELLRLHQLRHHLKRAMPGETTISKLALGLNFSDLGRMSGKYQRFFGEYPSQTLANFS